MKKARFVYLNTVVEIGNFDPSRPNEPIDKPWHKIQQEVFDQLEDSKKFTKDQLETMSELETRDFMKCIREHDENDTDYNRALAVYEYEHELEHAIKNDKPTTSWALGLDALKNGAVAKDYNY